MKIMKKIRLIEGLCALLLILAPGCKVWQHESHLEGVAAEGIPQTQSKYWIRVLPGDSLTSADTWEKCLSIYERRMPSVFSRNGTPVFIELESDFQYSPSVGFTVLNGLLSTFTLYIIPLRRENQMARYYVHTSLNERQRDAKTFTVAGSIRRWEGLLAALAPMPEVVDRRFVHSGSDGGMCRKEYAEAFGSDQGVGHLNESWAGEADAIVQGVACMLQQFEEDQRRANRSRKIGD